MFPIVLSVTLLGAECFGDQLEVETSTRSALDSSLEVVFHNKKETKRPVTYRKTFAAGRRTVYQMKTKTKTINLTKANQINNLKPPRTQNE